VRIAALVKDEPEPWRLWRFEVQQKLGLLIAFYALVVLKDLGPDPASKAC
jgi:hypothetical protein